MIGITFNEPFEEGPKVETKNNEAPALKIIRDAGSITLVEFQCKGRFGKWITQRISCVLFIRELLKGIDSEKRYDSLAIQYTTVGWSPVIYLYIPLEYGILRCYYDGEFCLCVDLINERQEVILSSKDLVDDRKNGFGDLTYYIDFYYKEIVVEHLKLMAMFSDNIRFNGSAFCREIK